MDTVLLLKYFIQMKIFTANVITFNSSSADTHNYTSGLRNVVGIRDMIKH
jgi:hypothetical protein